MTDKWRRDAPTPRLAAAVEALDAYGKVSAERKRCRIMAVSPGREPIDLTEDVVSLMDVITTTLDWGSGFFSDTDLRAFIVIADLLKIDVPETIRVQAQAGPRGELL